MPTSFNYESTSTPQSHAFGWKKNVGRLFTSGTSFFCYPFKVIYFQHVDESDSQLRVLVSASRRTFKNATDRNTIKRRIREAWRKNKNELLEDQITKGTSLDVGLIYTAKTILDSHLIEDKIKQTIQRLLQRETLDNKDTL